MKANVVSKYKGKSFRTVDIPNENIKDQEEQLGRKLNTHEKLEMVFRYGQNQFQPQNYPSVSMGDIIILSQDNDQFYIIEGFGFKKLSDKKFLQLRKFYEAMEEELNISKVYNQIHDFYKVNTINAI